MSHPSSTPIARRALTRFALAAVCAAPLAAGAIVAPAAHAAPTALSNLFHPSCKAQYYVTTPVMQDGCVTRIQEILRLKVDATLPVTGAYDAKTEAVIKKWKPTVGLSDSGLIGPQTKLKLEFATGTMRHRLLTYAFKAYNQEALGDSAKGQWNGGKIKYASDGNTMGAGHGTRPGPSTMGLAPDPNYGYLDCSGFSRWVHSLAFGYSNRTNPHGNWSTAGIRVNAPRISDLKPGDMIVWRNRYNSAGHVAIYAGDSKIVHSINGSLNGVSFTTMTDVDNFYAGGTKTYHRFA